jgi:hypothetical protein
MKVGAAAKGNAVNMLMNSSAMAVCANNLFFKVSFSFPFQILVRVHNISRAL